MSGSEVLWAVGGTLSGALISLGVGAFLQWVRRSGETRDRTGVLGAKLAGVKASLDHLSEDQHEIKASMEKRFDRVDARFDRLPCVDWCLPGGQRKVADGS